MTPIRSAQALIDAVADATVVRVAGGGHSLMAERPDEVLRALQDFAGRVFMPCDGLTAGGALRVAARSQLGHVLAVRPHRDRAFTVARSGSDAGHRVRTRARRASFDLCQPRHPERQCNLLCDLGHGAGCRAGGLARVLHRGEVDRRGISRLRRTVGPIRSVLADHGLATPARTAAFRAISISPA